MDIDTILALLQSIGICITAVWAIWRFRIESPTKPRIELALDAEFLGPQAGKYLASVSILVRNRGTVSHTIDGLELKIQGINDGTKVESFEERSEKLVTEGDMNHRICFPEKIVELPNLIPPDYKYYFVRAGVEQIIHYHTAIDANIRFVRVFAAFHYKGSQDKHTAEKIFGLGQGSRT
ncbi:MAG: hypothetical protein NW241_15515 [Bacteroidia bacterium]|nr:hypothetical protein [Bacteroidia bacterium]